MAGINSEAGGEKRGNPPPPTFSSIQAFNRLNDVNSIEFLHRGNFSTKSMIQIPISSRNTFTYMLGNDV